MHPKQAIDGVAAVTIVGSLAGYLPAVAALLGIIWYGMQMYDWIVKHRNAKRSRRRKSDKMSQV